MSNLELLAPARNIDIGIAAIDCGADAVYIAGPIFGARQAAGNSVEDIARLCAYAHKFGARVFVTVNTIIFDEELDKAEELIGSLSEAGADALIVQDIGLTRLNCGIPIHASTQCAIRTPEKARFYESLGFSRLVLERELSLEQIRAIRKAVKCELEFFVHGALCVCYSGQCYMSESICGRSANRGECIQACRSLYDLETADGKIIVRNKALLSMKDFNLMGRLEELAEAGVCSFKIEGRLKNISYVRNITRLYSSSLDSIIARNPEKYRRSSFGSVTKGFLPNPDKTFNRGYTELFIDGKRNNWGSMEATKTMGEFIGYVESIKKTDRHGNEMIITVRPKDAELSLSNGDGFAFVSGNDLTGFRGDVCEGLSIRCKEVEGLHCGTKLFRNLSSTFEKEMSAGRCIRLINVRIGISISQNFISAYYESEDGRKGSIRYPILAIPAENKDRMERMIKEQLSKSSGLYGFAVSGIKAEGPLPLLKVSFLNSIRRDIAMSLDKISCINIPMDPGHAGISVKAPESISYKDNVSNHLSREIYAERGCKSFEDAYEKSHKEDAELMRTKYCIRYELGLCPRLCRKENNSPLFLTNNGRKYELGFDCKICEMTVKAVKGQII